MLYLLNLYLNSILKCYHKSFLNIFFQHYIETLNYTLKINIFLKFLPWIITLALNLKIKTNP